MVSGVADGVCTAAGVVIDGVVAEDAGRVTRDIHDARGLTGEFDEAEGLGGASGSPAPRTARAAPTDAATRTNARNVLSKVGGDRRDVPER